MHLDGALALLSSVLGWFGRVYTSTYILDEALTLTKSRVGGAEAARLMDDILGSRKITIVRVERDERTFSDSMAKFKQHREVEGLSFTDCTTLVLREKMKIATLLSFDKGLKQFVPRLLGAGYCEELTDEQRDTLSKVARTLGIKLNFRP